MLINNCFTMNQLVNDIINCQHDFFDSFVAFLFILHQKKIALLKQKTQRNLGLPANATHCQKISIAR